MGNGVGDGLTNLKSIVPVQAGELTGVAAIGQGYYHSLAVTSDGHVWGWGRTSSASWAPIRQRLAYSDARRYRCWPGMLDGVVAVAGSLGTSLALKSDGSVGLGATTVMGSWGLGRPSNRSLSATPVQVSGFSDIVAIAAGEIHALALRSDGTVWSWGYEQ